MRRLLPLLVLVGALVAPGTASATTLGSRFPAFEAELTSRLAGIPTTHLTKADKKHKSALTRALAALAVDTEILAKAIQNARKAIVAADGAFPDDATLDPIEIAVIDGLASDANVRNSVLAVSIQQMPATASPPRTRAMAKCDAAGANLTAAKTAAPHTQRIRLVAGAVTTTAAGEKIVRKAGGTLGAPVAVTALDVDINNPANHLHVPQTEPPFGAYVVTYETATDSIKITGSGMVGTVNAKTHEFILTVPGHGLGTRELVIVGPSIYSSPDIMPPSAQPVGGSMTVTEWDEIGHKCAGTFDATFSNGVTTIHLMNGTFSTLEMKVQ